MNRFVLISSLLFLFLFQPAFAHADKRIGILVYDGVLTSDVTAPLEVFGVASRKTWFSDYEVLTIGIDDAASIVTEEGLKLGVDTSLANAPEVDAFITTSAYDMDAVLKNENLMNYIRKHAEKGAWLSSNCSGATLLAQAGVLDGKRATTWAGGEAQMQRDYPKVKVQVDQNVVVDGRFVTSNGSLVSYQGALTLLKLMSSPSKADEVAEVLQYSRFSQAKY